jgi:hypothetical protein
MLHDHTELIEPWIGRGLMLALVRGREAAQEFTDRGSNRPPLVATSFGASATAETPRPEHRRALSAFSLSSMDNTVDSVGHPDDS